MRLTLLLCLLPLSANGALPKRAFYEMNKGKDIIYGDVLLSERDKLIQQLPKNVRMSLFLKNGYNRWPNNVIPYDFSKDFNTAARNVVRAALNELERRTCFRFMEKKQHPDYVYFEYNGGCYSSIGRQGGKQTISFLPGCFNEHSIWHEMMHAMGIGHEHQRFDRDKYIEVKMDNVDPTLVHNFVILNEKQFETNGFAYDIKSIMHYHGYAFSKPPGPKTLLLPTMINKATNMAVPYNTKITDEDIKKINFIGNCPNYKYQPAKMGI